MSLLDDQLDRIARGGSPLHRLPARRKLVATLLIVVAVALSPTTGPPGEWIWWTWTILFSVLVAVILAAVAARLRWRYVAWRLTAFVSFLAMLALAVPLSHGFQDGWGTMAGVIVKGTLCFTCVLILTSTTPFYHLLAAAGQLGMPRLFVATVASMYRYAFLLLEERQNMHRARLARSFGHRRLGPRVAAQMIGCLLSRAYDRAEKVHAAMLARGFDGRVRTVALAVSGQRKHTLAQNRAMPRS